MGGASTSFLEINDVIMTSLLLLKIIFVLTNFLILSETLPALREIWILTIIQQCGVRLGHKLRQSSHSQKLEMMSTFRSFCVIFQRNNDKCPGKDTPSIE